MSQTLRTVGAAAIGALVVAVAALSVRPTIVAGAPTDPTTSQPAHTITVTATGSTEAVPDTAHVTLGVTLNRSTVKAARADAAKAMNDVVDAVKGLGIDSKDITTTGLNLNPQYDNASPSRVVGYSISEQLTITIRDLDKTDDVVDTATAKGATDVGGIWFEVSDPEKVQNDARADAVASARKSAQALADAAGVSLGKVVTISDSTPYWRGYATPMFGGAMSAGAPDAAVKTPIEPGSQELTSTVTVVFDIS